MNFITSLSHPACVLVMSGVSTMSSAALTSKLVPTTGLPATSVKLDGVPLYDAWVAFFNEEAGSASGETVPSPVSDQRVMARSGDNMLGTPLMAGKLTSSHTGFMLNATVFLDE